MESGSVSFFAISDQTRAQYWNQTSNSKLWEKSKVLRLFFSLARIVEHIVQAPQAHASRPKRLIQAVIEQNRKTSISWTNQRNKTGTKLVDRHLYVYILHIIFVGFISDLNKLTTKIWLLLLLAPFFYTVPIKYNLTNPKNSQKYYSNVMVSRLENL